MKTKDIEEIVKKLRMVSNMINMGEKIRWGQETTLMDEAADMLEKLTHHHEAEVEKAVEAAKLEQAEFEMKLLEAHITLITEDKIWTDSVYNYIDGRLQALTPTKTDKQ